MPDLTMPDLDGAICAEVDPALFFPDHKGASSRGARAVCDVCPLATRTACLEWAIAHHEEGIWGGTSERQRRAMRRQRRTA